MKNNIEILDVVGSDGIGGVQNFIATLAAYDNKYNINRNLLCLYKKSVIKSDELSKSNIKLYNSALYIKDSNWRPYRFWKTIRMLLATIHRYFYYYNCIKKSNPDIVICHEPYQIFFQLITCKIFGIPFVLYMHKEFDFYRSTRFLKYFINNTYFLSVSKKLAKNNLGEINYYNKRLKIITATSNLEYIANYCHEYEKNNECINIGTIGRLSWEKNFEDVIYIASKLKYICKKKINISIVGDGPERKKLKELIEEMELSDTVFLLGAMNFKDISSYLFDLDIYIQTSITEGSPLTIKEAMAASLPVISTNVSGIPELITDGKNGFLIKKGDSDAFVNKLNDIINMSGEKRKIVGKKGQKSILEKYSTKIIAKKYADYCNYILDKDL